MKASYLSSIALAVAALSAGQAFAADADAALTREQVRAELIQAQQAGDVIGDNESGRTCARCTRTATRPPRPPRPSPAPTSRPSWLPPSATAT